jgi:hypothetical protein
MDVFPSSLNVLIREQRKFKKPFSQIIRKLLAFQIFKALYYLQVDLSHPADKDLPPRY